VFAGSVPGNLQKPACRREMIEDEAAAAPQLAEIAGLAALLLTALLLRLVPVLFVPSINWGDEIFQATEQAHRLVYGTGLVPWEFEFGVRSWLLPGAIAGLMEFARLFGDGPRYYLPVISLAFAGLAAAPVLCSYLWARRFYGLRGAVVAGVVVAVAPEIVYFGARTLSEAVAGNLLVVALYLLERGFGIASRRRLFAAGTVLALVFALRLQLAPALAAIGLWAVWGDRGRRLPVLIAGAAAILALVAVLDTVTLG
jgi:GPI mannosyltransferase 3